MKSIKAKTSHEIVIKKSRFIAVAYPIFSEDDAANAIHKVKAELSNANHYTYAYILGDTGITQKASDDGEPTRTAGFPILDVLLNQNLTNIIVIVVRYFGGIKLGAGGLIRAYSTAASEVLKRVHFTTKKTTYTCTVTCSYDVLGSMEQYIREHTSLLDVMYDQEIRFTFQVLSTDFESIKEHLFHRNHYQDLVEIIKETEQWT